MNHVNETLTDLGWSQHFDAQVTADQWEDYMPVRVMAVHRGQISVAGAGVDAAEQHLISPYIQGAVAEDLHPTVGDWILISRSTGEVVRVLARMNLFKRRAAGDGRKEQMIAANVDTLFIVASCNQDFNVARIERYLVLAREVEVEPIVVLTKIDLTDRVQDYIDAVRSIEPDLRVEAVNGCEAGNAARLSAWCGRGKTVALMGSSGVGKSTLVNSLRGDDSIATQSIRASDDTGRHTTTHREMHRLEHGGWLMDTPGMRELQLSDANDGIAEIFDDFIALAQDCRFSNCSHKTEPGCAIRAALEAQTVTQDRYDRWRKLVLAEEEASTPTYPKRRR